MCITSKILFSLHYFVGFTFFMFSFEILIIIIWRISQINYSLSSIINESSPIPEEGILPIR